MQHGLCLLWPAPDPELQCEPQPGGIFHDGILDSLGDHLFLGTVPPPSRDHPRPRDDGSPPPRGGGGHHQMTVPPPHGGDRHHTTIT